MTWALLPCPSISFVRLQYVVLSSYISSFEVLVDFYYFYQIFCCFYFGRHGLLSFSLPLNFTNQSTSVFINEVCINCCIG